MKDLFIKLFICYLYKFVKSVKLIDVLNLEL